jgi:hypothetical protein
MGKQENFDERLLKRLTQEAKLSASIPPQNLGRFTSLFKTISPFVKSSPWKVLIPISIGASVLAIIFMGGWALRVTSILQRGF